MDVDAEDFVTLLGRARDGHQDAIQRLVQVYEPELRLVARVRLGSALRPFLDSVDLVQSVHRSLLMGLRQDKFDVSSPAKLVALALTMVRRKVARQWRRMQRQRRLGSSSGNSSSLPEMLTSLSDSHADPAQEAEFNDQVEHLCAALSDSERKLIELRLQDYSTAEIARRLGLDADVLRVRLGRLRRRLRDSGILTDWL